MAKIEVVNHVLQDYKKNKFWDEGDTLIDSLLDELASSRTWRTDIELYEYLSYVLDQTALELRDFEKINSVIWSSLLSVNFGKSLPILDDEQSPDYLLLNNFYPLTEPLKDCQLTLAKLNRLVMINQETAGYNHDIISQEGRKLYEELYSNFKRMKEENFYMTMVDNIDFFQNFISRGLHSILAMENVSSTQVSLTESNNANQLINQIRESHTETVTEVESNDTPVDDIEHTESVSENVDVEDDSDITDPNFIAQVAQDTPVEINNASIDLSTRDDGTSSIVKDVIQVPTSGSTDENIQEISSSVDNRAPMDKIDGNRIDNLLYKDFDLNVFIDAFNELESHCYISERQNNMADIKYFLSVARDLFSEFDTTYKKIENEKPRRGQPDLRNLDEWQRTSDHVKKFSDKWFTKYKDLMTN